MRKLNRENFDEVFSVRDVLEIVGDEWKEDIDKDGLWKITLGCRGEVDDIEWLGLEDEVFSSEYEVIDDYGLSDDDEFVGVGFDLEYKGVYSVIVNEDYEMNYLWVERR